MVSSISFGSVNTVNGKTVLTGSQSGIDTNALITALTAAKQVPATQAQDKITANQTKITTLTQLKTALQSLQDSVDALRNPTFGSSATNAFAARSPFLSITNGKTVADYLGVSTSAGAAIGKYTIQVDHLATAESDQSVSFTDRTSSIVGAAGSHTDGDGSTTFAAGTFQINGINVTVNQGDNLNNVVSSINSVTDRSNVTASVIKLSDTDYRLVLTNKNTGGTAGAINITDTSNVLPFTTTPPMGHAAGQTMFNQTQPPGDAQLEFNNQTITRSTNKISDLIDNVTFSLYGATNGETITLDIDKDNTSIATSIGTFVDSYNAIRTFQAQQEQRDANGDLVKTAVLANDPTLNTVINQLSSLISGQASIAIPSLYSSGNITAPTRLGDLGISLTDQDASTDKDGNPTPAVTNLLSIDPSKLNSSLESYFDQVSNIFQFNFSSSSPAVGIYKRTNTVTNSNFGITVDTSQPVGSQASITTIDGSGVSTPIALDFKTTTTQKSSSFIDNATSSFVNAAGTDNPGAFAAGTFQINGANVTLAQNMTLTGVMNAINLASATSGVKASIVKNGTSDYSLMMTGTADGTNGINITDADHVLPTTPIFSTTSSISTISGKANSEVAGFNTSYTGTGNDTITRAANITNKDISLSIDTTQSPGQEVKVTKIFGATLTTPIYMNYSVSGGSATISGKTGTPFDGLQMIYTGDGSDDVNISMSQGIGDKLYNSINGLINGDPNVPDSVSLIDEAIQNLQDSDTSLQKSIDTINDQVSTLRDQLLTKFAALEASITASNQLLQLLEAQSNASLVNSGH